MGGLDQAAMISDVQPPGANVEPGGLVSVSSLLIICCIAGLILFVVAVLYSRKGDVVFHIVLATCLYLYHCAVSRLGSIHSFKAPVAAFISHAAKSWLTFAEGNAS